MNVDNQTDTSGFNTPTKFKLICASKVKKFTLEYAKQHKPRFTRCSKKMLFECEAVLKDFIERKVKSMPSRGKTLM